MHFVHLEFFRFGEILLGTQLLLDNLFIELLTNQFVVAERQDRLLKRGSAGSYTMGLAI